MTSGGAEPNMGGFAINDLGGGIALVVGPPRDEQGHYYAARLSSSVLSASVDVYDHHASHLAEFFAELAALWWDGWDGDKTYESLEGQLRLVATRDAVGHVFLDVTLRDGMGGPEFRAGARLQLYAAQLESIAEGARGALGTRPAAGP